MEAKVANLNDLNDFLGDGGSCEKYRSKFQVHVATFSWVLLTFNEEGWLRTTMLSLRYHYSVHTRFCGYQCVTVPKILNDTDIPILFFLYQIFPIPMPVLYSIPNLSDTGSETFSGTKFFRYWFRYHQKISVTHYKSSKFKKIGDKN